jgi:CO dehydrogenase nickel-insertion accessory protein CooC1
MAGQVIAVLNMKGGVGKTTVSPHVMRVLYHNMQRKILLVDLDPQFYLTQCLMSWVATKRRRSAGHIFQKRTARVDRSAYRPSKTSPTGGKLDLGTWQRIFFFEFDGQRDKRVIVKVMVKILTASWL